MIPERSKDITTDWLNKVLHDSGYLKNENIMSIDIKPMAIGEGFVSEMARISLTYDKDDSRQPKTMIAKMPTSYESALAVALMFNLYEREIRFYAEVAGESPIRTPGLIYWDVDSKLKRYILIMEDCSQYSQIDQIEGMTHEQLKQVALKIADFHAYWWESDKLKSFTWMPTNKGESAAALIATYRGCWDASIQMEDFVASLPGGGREVGLKIHEKIHWLIDAAPDDHLSISHFDFRADNFFFDSENRDNPVIIFDWGSANRNRGVIDLSYLLGGSIAIELRRKIEKDIIRLYHDRLSEKGISGYSFDECWIDYLKGTLIFAYIPVLAFASLDMSDERGMKLGKILTNRHFATIVDNDATSVFPT